MAKMLGKGNTDVSVLLLVLSMGGFVGMPGMVKQFLSHEITDHYKFCHLVLQHG